MALGVSFGLMAFTTFVYDTLDVCTRLGRYILQELLGWHDRKGKILAAALTAGVPLIFLLWQPEDPATGKLVPTWRLFWTLFGASNQLLAALTLMGVTVWLWRTRRAAWVWLVTGLPTVWMYTVSMLALIKMIGKDFQAQWLIAQRMSSLGPEEIGSRLLPTWLPATPVPYVAVILVTLGALMAVEAARVLLAGHRQPPTAAAELVGAPG
jgi:carbon starvation protein